MFNPLPSRPSAVDACEAALVRAIVAGELPPGSRLPPERRLAERLGVHRVTLRAALSRLSTRRLISARQGSGNYVEDWRDRGGLSLLPELASLDQRHGIAADLLLLRRQMARAVLIKVCEAGAGAAANALGPAIDMLERCAGHGGELEAIAAADLEIVRRLLDASDSLVLRMCWNPMLSTLDQLPDLKKALYRHPAQNVAGWRALQSWLQAPNEHLIDAIIEEMRARDEETLSALASEP